MLLMAVAALFLVTSCSRKPFTIGDIGFHPTVVASHRADIRLETISEGFGIVIGAQEISEGQLYQVSIIAPGGNYRWEFATYPSTLADMLVLMRSDLLLPQDVKLESGEYLVEILLPDGRRLSKPYAFRRTHVMDTLLLESASLPPPDWEKSEEGEWEMRGIVDTIDSRWTYTLLDETQRVLLRTVHRGAHVKDELFSDPDFRAKVRWIIATRYDEMSGITIVVRSRLT